MEKNKTSYQKQLKSEPNDFRNKFLSFIKDNAYVIALVLIFIFFYRFWESWIGNHIIAPFLSHFESNLLSDIIFFLGIIVCLIFTFINWEKRIKWQAFFIHLLAIVIWVYYRFSHGPHGLDDSTYFINFKPLYLCDGIKYFDIIPLFALSKLIPTIPSFFSNKVEETFEGGFKTEVSVDRIEEDSLGRKSFVEYVINTMLKTNTTNGAFTFGIDAPWGAGKSSVMRMMKEQITKSVRAEVISGKKELKDPIIMDFNPWLYAADKDLSSVFFDELSIQLKRYDDNLAQNIIDYSKLISAFDTPETKILSSLIDLARHDDISLQTKKQLISNAIKRIRKRIFIFIDDLDRLDANEILEMMKLIRNTSDFPYMYFIAAYDREYLIKCLKDKMPTKELGFTEKIFQVEYKLPEASKAVIASKSLRLLKESFNEIDSNDLRFFSRSDNQLNNEFLELFLNLSTLRDVKRLINNFKISKELSDDKVNTRELLLMELFRIKYPSAYSYYTNFRTQEEAQNEGFNLDSFNNALEGDKAILNLNETDLKNIIKILFDIYSKTNSAQLKALENCFLPLETNVGLSDFNALMKNEDVSEILNEIDLWLFANKTSSLIDRLKNYRPSTINENKALIEVLVYLSSKNLMVSNYALITQRINDYSHVETNANNLQVFISSTFIKHGNSHILSYLRLLHDKEWSFPLSREMVDVIRAKIFDKHIQDDRWPYKITELIRCYRLCAIHDGTDEKKFILDVNEQMRAFAEEHFIDFIPHIILFMRWTSSIQKANHDVNGNSYIDPIVTDIWGSWDSFRIFLSKLDSSNSNTLTEFMEFYDEYEQKGYGPIKFDFKNIQIKGEKGRS